MLTVNKDKLEECPFPLNYNTYIEIGTCALFIVLVLLVIVCYCLCCKKNVTKEVETVEQNPEYGVDYDDRESQIVDRNNYYLPPVDFICSVLSSFVLHILFKFSHQMSVSGD